MKKAALALMFSLSLIVSGCSSEQEKLENETALINEEDLTISRFNSELTHPLQDENSLDKYIYKDATIDFSIVPTTIEKGKKCDFVSGTFNETYGEPKQAQAYICNANLKVNQETKMTGTITGLKTVEGKNDEQNQTYLIIENTK